MTQKQKIENKKRGKFQNPNKKKRKVSYLLLFNKILFSIIVLIAVYFVASINDLAIKGFVLRDIKLQKINLEKENREIELKIMALQSLENIDSRAKDLKMVKVDDIDYLRLMDNVVAKR